MKYPDRLRLLEWKDLLHYEKMQTEGLKGKKKDVVAETASSSESKDGSENLAAGSDGHRSEEVEDSVSILRSKAQGRVFPGSSWFDGKHLR